MQAALVSGTIHAAQVQAFRHPLVAPPPTGFRGGLVLGDGIEAAKLRHSRYWRPVDVFNDAAIYSQHLGSRFIYAGPIYHHFGHFMSEMVHRILPSLGEQEGRRWLFVGAKGDPLINAHRNAPGFFHEVLEFFEISPDRVVICNDDAAAEDLFVSEQGSDFGGGPKPGYLPDLRDYWNVHAERLAGSGDYARKLFVSRSHVAGGRFLGEAYLEEVLARAGFTVFRPERHSLLEQMNHYRHAEAVVFSEGSACHGTELLGEGMMGRCALLSRRANHLDIFSRVLRPRSRDFSAFLGSVELGSIVGAPGSAPMTHLGVSLPDPAQLRAFLERSELAPGATFEPAVFIERASDDLDHYIAHHEARGTSIKGPAAGALREAFATAKGSFGI